MCFSSGDLGGGESGEVLSGGFTLNNDLFALNNLYLLLFGFSQTPHHPTKSHKIVRGQTPPNNSTNLPTKFTIPSQLIYIGFISP